MRALNQVVRFSLSSWGLTCLVMASHVGAQAPESADVLTAAQQSRHTWRGMPGFAAQVTVTGGGHSVTVPIEVNAHCETKLVGDRELPEWAQRKVASIVSHRRYRDPDPQQTSYVAESEPHVYGPAIASADGSSQYRVVEGVLREVVRRSEDSWLEIDTIKVLVTEGGHYLPEISVVHYRDPKSGDLKSSRTNYYTWENHAGFYLPSSVLEVELGPEGSKTTRTLVFSDHALHSAASSSTPASLTVAKLGADGASADAEARANVPGRLHRSMKEPLTSFGAAVLGEHLYVFSGHDGAAHGFGKDLLSKHFRRIRFDDPNAEWEELPMHAPAQSVALVTDGQYLYRVGGLSFLNELGDEETNYNSTDHFARFDVASQTWEDLPSLPESRSSLDAAVLGRHLYVAGGWNLQGSSSSDAPWAEDMLRFDLDHPENGWESLPGPGYQSRAISLAAHDGKIYYVGGIQQRGITRKVSVYDPDQGQWSEGPELPADSSTAGFATSSFATGGHLYVTGGSGVLYRLSQDGSQWAIANRLFYPRMFLRLVPADSHRLLAVGGTGASGAGRMAVVESVNVDPSLQRPYKATTWSVDFDGRAKHSQSLVLVGSQLYAFGGNASRQPHDFSQDAFVKEAFAFDVTDGSVEQLPDMPLAMQSGMAVVNRQTSEHQNIAVFGGIGYDSGMTALDSIRLYDPETKTWDEAVQKLPQPRSMFEAVTDSDAIWSFGGAGGTGSALLTDVLHWWGDDSEVTPLPDIQLPTPRRSFASAQVGREVYLIGGLGEGNKIAEQVDVFHLDDRTWRTVSQPHSARVFPSAAVVGGRIYLHGGFAAEAGHFAPASALEAYDPETDAWEVVAEELKQLDNSMQMLAYSDRLLFFGVDKQQDGVANFVLFDPEPTAAPSQVAPMQFGRGRGSRDDSAESTKMLMRRDKDKDGKLTRAELGSRLAELLDGDQDGDGALTVSELKAKLKADGEAEADSEADSDAETSD